MASVINTNTLSMVTQQNLNQSQNALNTSMERLSSGMRINSAKDDAAGQAIANRMSSQITGLSQAQRNANDGISVAQTAEGALNQVNDNLQRVRELTVQAANGTNNAEDLQSIQDEITMRMDEIDRISEQTSFNGVNVLSEDQSMNIQVGANDGEVISISLNQVNSSTLGLGSLDVTNMAETITKAGGFEIAATAAVAGLDTSTLNPASADSFDDGSETSATTGSSFTYTDSSGGSPTGLSVVEDSSSNRYVTDGTNYYAVDNADVDTDGDTAVAITFDSASPVTLQQAATAGVSASDNAEFAYADANGDALTGEYTVMQAKDETYYIKGENGDFYAATAAVSADTNTVTLTRTSDTKLTDTEISDAGLNPLGDLDDALADVDSQRSALGAVQNRFDSAITNLATTETNLASAQSRIQDADYAEEVSSMTTAQILQQAGTSMLTQANQVPQNVLSLLG